MPRKRKKSPSKLHENLLKGILQFLSGRRYKPLNINDLQKSLALPDLHLASFKKAIDELLSSRQIVEENSLLRLPAPQKNLARGPISVHPKGFGFVRHGKGDDIFIPKPFMNGAVDGDEVEVAVESEISPKGPEGKVVAILKRSRTHLAGVVTSKEGPYAIALSPLLGPKRRIVLKGSPLKIGDRIIVKVSNWHGEEETVRAELDRIIGHIDDPSCDVLAAIEEFELPSAFTEEALEEARKFGTKVLSKETKSRVNLTDLETVTIDPDTARDFDDAISLSKDEKGHFHLGVHIADVAHYVKPGGFLDQDARLRCNSTYFPGTVVPMLPHELSSELCSLKPKVNRLTATVLAEFSPKGDLLHTQIVRAVIKSKKRFTYREAMAVLEGKKKSPHLPLLERMVELCHLLKKQRFERGSIDFSKVESVIIVNEKGEPTHFDRVEYDITHQMIEEFMLKANEIVARHLFSTGKPLIYRIHEEPAGDTFEDFYTFARALGFVLPIRPTHRDIQHLFEQAKNSPLGSQLSIAFIRSMKIAAYSPENIGHYGLALEHYCHFTSPIRRYSDLIIERLLFNELPVEADLEATAAACSEKERISFKAEQSVLSLKKLRFAEKAYASDPERTYPATVTRIKPFSLSFEVPEFDLEGTLHISELGRDYFEYDSARLLFRGSRSGRTFQIGTPLFVRIEQIDLPSSQAKWAIASSSKIPRK
jgi:ribonuclease R